MVEPLTADHLLQLLRDELKKPSPNLSVENFVNVIKTSEGKRMQIYDLLEVFSQKSGWESFLTSAKQDLKSKTSRPDKVFLNQLIVLETQIKAKIDPPKKEFTHFQEKVISLETIKESFKYDKTETYVDDKDIFDCIKEFRQDQEHEICLIILGPNQYNGNHELGSTEAQIGALCRCTDFPLIATTDVMTQNSVVHYPELRLFRKSTGEFYPRPCKIQAMQIWSQKDTQEKVYTSEEIGEQLKKLMTQYFARAMEKDIKILILTALGCGFAENDPSVVARQMAQLVQGFAGAFEKIVFSILNKPTNEKFKKNYREFESKFGNPGNPKIFFKN